MSRIRWSLLCAVFFIALLVWSAVEGPSGTARRSQLDNALQRGELGGLTPERSAELTETLQWLLDAAGVNATVVLNQPFENTVPAAERLHVFTTTEGALAITGCAQGNAVYDGELDVIFIDQSLTNADDLVAIVEASPIGGVLSPSEMPFLQTYLRLIFLHELGHRQRHGRGASGHRSPKQMEQEADEFALARFEEAYRRDLADGGTHIGEEEDCLNLPRSEDRSARERLRIDVICMLSRLSMTSMFTSNPFAPFYEDAAHPSFLVRARGFIDAILQAPDLEAVERAHFEFFALTIDRQRQLASFAVAISPAPLGDVSFTDTEVTAVSFNLEQTMSLPRERLLAVNGNRKVVTRFETTVATHGVDEDANAREFALWTPPGRSGPFLIPTKGTTEIYELRGGHWSVLADGPLAQLVRSQRFGRVHHGPEPAESIVVEARDETAREWLHVLQADRVVASRSIEDISRDIRAAGGPAMSRLSVNTVGDDLYLLVQQRGEERAPEMVFGIAVLSRLTLEVKRVSELQLPEEMRNLGSRGGIVVAPTSTGGRTALIFPRLDGSSGAAWMAWELFTDSQPKELATRDHLVASVGKRSAPALQRDFDATFASALWMPPQSIVVSFNADSTYIVDLDSRRTEIVFHPGDEELQMRASRDGLLAVFLRGGRKCYLWSYSQSRDEND